MSSSAETATCACGQVLFDVADRKAGDTIKCPWCSKEYRFLGGTRIEPLTNSNKPMIVMEGSEEVFKFDAPEKSPTQKVKALSTRGRRQVSVRQSAPATGENNSESTAKKKKPMPEAPGGVLPMVGFMGGGFLVAALILAFLFPENSEKVRMAPWGGELGLPSPWPDLIAFTLGQILAFVAWAFYVYRLHLKQKAAALEMAANPEAAQNKTSTRQKPEPRRKKSSDDDDDAGDED